MLREGIIDSLPRILHIALSRSPKSEETLTSIRLNKRCLSRRKIAFCDSVQPDFRIFRHLIRQAVMDLNISAHGKICHRAQEIITAMAGRDVNLGTIGKIWLTPLSPSNQQLMIRSLSSVLMPSLALEM